jgi:hypothetical protein
MTALGPDRWRAVSPYLNEALEIASDERAAWLASIHARDAALADDLRTLLADHAALHESGFLERAVPGWAACGWPSAATAGSKAVRRSNC